MVHVALLGDSIFDNARYVEGGLPVIAHLKQRLPVDWQASLLAVDGHVTSDVASQLQRLPADTTHLVVSVGGNDAIRSSGILLTPANTIGDALRQFAEALNQFRDNYRAMLALVLAQRKPTAVCSIYDAIPQLEPEKVTALALYNDVILREAFVQGIPVVDLRSVCDESSDFFAVSPIEPSSSGGAKIAASLVALTRTHNFGVRQSSVFV